MIDSSIVDYLTPRQWYSSYTVPNDEMKMTVTKNRT